MDAKRFEVTRSDEERRRLPTPEQYAVMRGHGTERPGSCATPVLGLRRSAARITAGRLALRLALLTGMRAGFGLGILG
jgi:hypothetical protein